MTVRRNRGAHAPPSEPGVRRRIVRASRSLLLIAVLAAGGVYVVRDLVFVGDRGPVPSVLGAPASAGATQPSVTSARVGSDTGETAPDFVIPTADGGVFRLSSYRGRVVVMDFLAPGCESCAAEISTLTKTWDAFKNEGVVVVVLDIGGLTPAQAAGYYRGLGGGNLVYGEDRGFHVGQAYDVIDLSSTFVVDRRGIVTYWDSGFTGLGTLEAAIRKSLA